MLFVCPRDDWESKLDRNRFASLMAIKEHIERQQGKVVITGPGWPQWDEHCSAFDNVSKLGEPWFDLALIYHVFDVDELPAVRTITCNEAYLEKDVESHLRNRPDYVVLHHTNEAASFSDTPLYHLHHCADPSIFYDSYRPRIYDVTLVGFCKKHIYPLRAKLANVLSTRMRGFRCHQHQHPGYEIADPDAAVKAYADVIRNSKIVVTCTSKYYYRLSKLAEIPLCGALMATDLPKDGADFFRRFVIELKPDDSEEVIEAKLKTGLRNWDQRAQLGKRLTEESSLQSHYAARFLNAYDHHTSYQKEVKAEEIEFRPDRDSATCTSDNPYFAAIYTVFCRLADKGTSTHLSKLMRLSDGRLGFDHGSIQSLEDLNKHVPEITKCGPSITVKCPFFWSDPRTLIRIPGINMRIRKVLMVADSDAWCWHYKATSIVKYCQGSVDIDVAYTHANKHESTVYDDSLLKTYDHVHFFGWWSVSEAVFALQSQGLLTVSVTLAATPIKTSGKDMKPFIKKRAAVVAVSPHLAEWCEENNVGSSVHRCYNGVDTDIFVAPPPRPVTSRPLKLLMCNKPLGPNDTDDSHGLLIAERVKKMLKDTPDVEVTLHIARATSSNLLNQQQMVELYKSHDVYAFTGRHHLGTPNTAFEAAACGCALVCTANGCLPALFDSADGKPIGFLTELPQRRSTDTSTNMDKQDKRIAQEVVDKVKMLASDGTLSETQSNVRAVVEEHWSWKKRAQSYAEVFDLRPAVQEVSSSH
jgi:glycosyltransferase involved in cell wall biosynthesis